jgi:pSer/pThr/pTyr-binding forkhead associated (FHA) protein
VTVELARVPRLRSGRYNVVGEVVEGPEGLPAGSVVLPDGARIVLGSEPIVIGRLPECAVVLGDPNVSRRHAEIRRHGSEVVVVDLQSTNGTRVNGIPVREQLLADGDEVSVGTTVLRFEAS